MPYYGLNILLAAFAGLFLTLTTRYDLIMLQQLSYRPERGYLKKAFLSRHFCCIAAFSAPLCAVHFLPFGLRPLTLLLLLFALAAVTLLVIKTKLGLRVTPRMGRLVAAEFAVCFAAAFFLPVFVATLALPLLTLVAFYVMLPFETLNNRRYVRRAAGIFAAHGGKKVAICGSFGKTGCKNILKTLLSGDYKCAATPQSYNTPLGIARFSSQLTGGEQVLIFEFGARRKGDIAELCRIVRPDLGIFTGAARQHLETFKTFDTVVDTKLELLDFLPQSGACVVNAQNAAFENAQRRGVCVKIPAGFSSGEYYAENAVCSAEGSKFTLVTPNGKVECRTRLIGRHNISNIVMCAALCSYLGMEREKIAAQIEKIEQTPHRLEVVRGKGGVTIIDDSYNANPEGVAAAAECLGLFSGKKYAVLQGICEAGAEQFAQNVQAGEVMGAAVDAVVVVGANSDALRQGLLRHLSAENILHASSAQAAAELLRLRLVPGSVILFQNDLIDV